MLESSLSIYLIAGAVICFLGTLPLGPINLTVVKITVERSQFRGFEVAIAASLVEIVQALIAAWFGMVISAFIDSTPAFRVVIASVFVLLGILVLTRQPRQRLEQEEDDSSEFLTGFLVAVMNPQAIPFWIFALTAGSQYFDFEYAGIFLLVFLLGVFVGKLLALGLFVLAAGYLRAHLQKSEVFVNRLLAAVLLFIGITQWTQILLQS